MNTLTLLDVGKLSKESLLPPIKFCDGSYTFHDQEKSIFLKHLSQTLRTLKTIFCKGQLPLKEVWPQYKNEISFILILCGENQVKSDWNTEEIVCDVRNLLDSFLVALCVSHLDELFLTTPDLATSIIDMIRNKLLSSCYMEYPATVECFHWVTLNNKIPSVEHYAAFALPISLNLLKSSYENSYQQKGLDCIYIILSRSNSSSLHHFGWIGVIFDALKDIHHQDNVDDTVKLYKSLHICLITLHPMKFSPSYLKNKDSWADNVLYDFLKLMEMESSEESRCIYLELLISFIRSLQFKAPQFLPILLPIIDHYIDGNFMSPNLCLQLLTVVEHFIINCWPCVQLNLNEFTWILSKLVLTIQNLSYDGTEKNKNLRCDIEEVKNSCLEQFSFLSPECYTLLCQSTS